MDETPLSDILSSEPTETPAPEAQPPADDRPRDEQGRFVSASDPGDETPEAASPPTEAAPPAAQQDAEPGHIPVKALQDERQKRQQAEEQLRQYEAYFTSLQQPQQQQPQAPDPNVDFNGWLNWRDQQIAAQIRDHVMQEVEQRAENFGTMTRAQVSEQLARQRHPDYDEKLAVVVEAVQTNPHIANEIRNAADPAEHAYKVASNILTARQLGSTDLPSRDALKDEIRAELMAELGLSSTPKAPSSLASERSVGSRSGPAWAGPAAIGDILR